jgi:TolB-like protein/AraC-like DNA-binding protein
MNKEFIKRLTDLVEENLSNEKFGPDDLVREADMSHSNLNRKLKTFSNQNASQFIREIRLKKAKELLLNNDLTAAEISYRVGFGSPTYFNKCFREYFGVAPGELRKQDPENQAKELHIEIIPRKSNRRKILIGLPVILIILIPIMIFITNKISGSNETIKEKSIAVLSFKYLSNEAEKQYLADGMMDAILVHLSKIKDLRVVSRTSVEHYRKTDKTSKIIGQELGVEYLLEGSYLMEGDNVRLILQLIKTSDDSHVWSDIFDSEWKNIFSIQSEIAETVARQLKAVITPEEQQLIRKEPTTNLTAYNYYLRGNDLLEKYEFVARRDSITLKTAQHHFQKSLELDSTFALAYTGLAAVQFWISRINYLSDIYLDSVLFYANKALACDNQCSEAYYFRGYAYSQTFKISEALKEADKALQYNPNNWKAYFLRFYIFGALNDDVGSISNLYEDVLRNRGIGQTNFLIRFSYSLSDMGFPDLAKKYNQQALELYDDTTQYLYCSAYGEYCNENLENAYQLAKTASKRNHPDRHLVRDPDLSFYCMVTGRYEEAYSRCLKYYENKNNAGGFDADFSTRIAFYLMQNKRTKEAEQYLNQVIRFNEENIKSGRLEAIQRMSHYNLAEMYALSGNKEKAYQYLEEVNKNQSFPWYWLISFRNSPFFALIRQEPRFQKILNDVDAKYRAEHKRVAKWLKEHELL